MPQNWKTYSLIELLEFAVDCPHSTPKWTESGVCVLRSYNIRNGKLNFDKKSFTDEPHYQSRIKRAVPRGGDIIITREAPMGEVCMLSEGLKTCLGQRMVLLRPSEETEGKFILYVLQSPFVQNQIRMHEGTGSTVSNLRIPALENLRIPVPPLPIQRRIASILGALDDKIELNLEMNKTLEEMAMALYKHWFVDFGPFKDGNFVESELGMIPEGWKVKSIGELLKIKHGYAFKGKFFQQIERPELLLTPGNFQREGGIKFNWGKQKFYSGEIPSDYILNRGDLLMALTDLTQSCDILGAPAFIPDNDYIYLHNQRLGLVEKIDPRISKEIIYCLANSNDFRSYIKNTKTGSTVSHTSPNRIYEYKIAIPSDAQLERLNIELKELTELKFSNLSENKVLTEIRDAILPKLISGEVEVKGAEEEVSNVV